jgi:hypothetical protein
MYCCYLPSRISIVLQIQGFSEGKILGIIEQELIETVRVRMDTKRLLFFQLTFPAKSIVVLSSLNVSR